jgi:heme/copper-type cytochrome/quinol oxidase subunit 2
LFGNNVPLTPTDMTAHKTWSLLDLILMIITVLALLILIGRWVYIRLRNDDEEKDINGVNTANDDLAPYKPRVVLTCISIFAAFISIVVFLGTQNFTGSVVVADVWTILFAVAAIAGGIASIFAFKTQEEDADDNDDTIGRYRGWSLDAYLR